MADPILYSFRRCPYAMRARLALRVSGASYEHREIVLRDKPQHMLEISPKGTVPVLLLSDGTVLEESLDIMRWALQQNDPESWLGRVDEELVAVNDGPFKHHLDRYKYAPRYDGADPLEHRAACAAILQGLENHLAAQPFLSGQTRGFTDAAIAPFVRQFANTDREWFDAQDWPHMQRWLSDYLASDLFAEVMRKHPLWVPGG
ncbi:glutathione S-transferase [Alteraurantiacibacter aquimixticola]|uniref:Glutathione S-transferase n=1 Tax=Alteraurantiacibacter aquimixticola TaxID=2489173 RepID=A0A4T3F2Q5_9SPHN|nr:glutathione S-transferase [Alteraurantiacibacter aquimixticola]TIX50595.1 glutathione S-transferase [Alteraurantiacibacter aquimixticola]